MRDDRQTRPRTAAAKERLSYVAPRLVTYGALADITRDVGTNSNMDGGAAAGMMMSQP